MAALDDLTAELHRISDGDADPATKTAQLTDLRERINDVLGEADSLISDQHRQRESRVTQARRQKLAVRENATLREGLIEDGFSPAELDEAAVLSHDELDRLREEGLESEAVERISAEHG